MVFNDLKDAVKHAVTNYQEYIVQRHFIPEEYMDMEVEVPFDVDTALNCEYEFFTDLDEANMYRRTNMWSRIVGSHQSTIDVKKYIEYYRPQENLDPEINEIINLYDENRKCFTLSMNPNLETDDDDLPF